MPTRRKQGEGFKGRQRDSPDCISIYSVVFSPGSRTRKNLGKENHMTCLKKIIEKIRNGTGAEMDYRNACGRHWNSRIKHKNKQN